MAVTTFGSKLCKALGLDPNRVTSIKLISCVHEIDKLEIWMLADDGTYGELGTIFKEYEIVPIEEDAL